MHQSFRIPGDPDGRRGTGFGGHNDRFPAEVAPHLAVEVPEAIFEGPGDLFGEDLTSDKEDLLFLRSDLLSPSLPPLSVPPSSLSALLVFWRKIFRENSNFLRRWIGTLLVEWLAGLTAATLGLRCLYSLDGKAGLSSRRSGLD